MNGEASCVLIERRGPVAVIVLNRPERRNGITVEMCHAMYQAARDVAASDARVAILRGAGENFCVGADIAGETEKAGGGPVTLEDLGLVHHASAVLHNAPQVVIAAIDGGCAGAGLAWATACDFRFAAHRARFSTAFLKVGVPGDMGLAWSLARIVGGARAREMLFFPEKIDGARALELDLVTRLFPHETLHRDVMALAEELCEAEPFALRMMKANMVSAEELGFGEFIDIETARQLHVTGRPDFAKHFAAAFARSKSKGLPHDRA